MGEPPLLIEGLTAVGLVLTVGVLAVGAIVKQMRSRHRLIRSIADALGVQGDLHYVPDGYALTGAFEGCAARVEHSKGPPTFFVSVPGVSRRAQVVAFHRDPSRRRMAYPHDALPEWLLADGDLTELVGLLAPEVRAALSAANAAVLGPHVALQDGYVTVYIARDRAEDDLSAIRARVAAVVAALMALPTGTPARLEARVADPEEHLAVRVLALRLALERYAGRPETEAAIEAALASGHSPLIELATARRHDTPLQGRLSILEVEEAGALSEAEGAGGLSLDD
ncbi:MAG: hypothetical protein KC933_32230 [Myxococcales bacterium]|nr:hypothetical protein [Myxococcales bacterium]